MWPSVSGPAVGIGVLVQLVGDSYEIQPTCTSPDLYGQK